MCGIVFWLDDFWRRGCDLCNFLMVFIKWVVKVLVIGMVIKCFISSMKNMVVFWISLW